MTPDTIAYLIAASFAFAIGLLVAFGEGYRRGASSAEAPHQKALDRARTDSYAAGLANGLAQGWRDAHRRALTTLTEWPTSKGGRAIVAALAKGPNADLGRTVPTEDTGGIRFLDTGSAPVDPGAFGKMPGEEP